MFKSPRFLPLFRRCSCGRFSLWLSVYLPDPFILHTVTGFYRPIRKGIGAAADMIARHR